MVCVLVTLMYNAKTAELIDAIWGSGSDSCAQETTY